MNVENLKSFDKVTPAWVKVQVFQQLSAISFLVEADFLREIRGGGGKMTISKGGTS